MLSRLSLLPLALVFALVLGGADGCSSDPNVEGAKLYIRSGELDQALTRLDEALAANPDNADALVLRADVRRRQIEDLPDGASDADPAARQAAIDQVVADLDRARSIDPTVGGTERVLAWAYAVNEGNRVLRTADADPADAAGLLRASTVLMPDSVQGYFSLGLAHLQLDQPAEAIAPLQRSIELDPDATGYYYLGRAYVMNDQMTQAVEAFETGSERFPDDADLQTAVLDAYVRAGQPDRAVGRYETAIAGATPGSEQEALLRYNYGSLLLQAERYDEAQEQLQRAIAVNPNNADAQYNLGATFNNQARAFDEQARSTQDNDEANRLTDQRNELLEQALVPLLRARELTSGTPDEANSCQALFRVYAQLGRNDEAAEANECAGGSSR